MRQSLAIGILLAALPTVSAQGPEVTTPGHLRPHQGSEVAFDSASPPREAAGGLLDRVIPIHTAPDDPEGGAYGVWAAGRQYKVSFHGDPTFVPYLGADYPHNQPLRWTTESITVGSAVLVGAGDVAERFHTDTRYEYRYARGVVEAYDVLVEGLEQTFVLRSPPSATGDFVVTGRFTTGLEVVEEFAGEHRGIAFADGNGTELIRYGAAYVLDARGRREPVATSIRGHQVSLTVPAAFLRSATYPVILDPLTTAVQIDSGSEILQVDVCRNDRNDNACLTYCRAASATDADCYGWNSPQDLSAIGTAVFSDLSTSWSTDQTSTAHIGPAAVNRFVICISRKFSTSSGIRIWDQDASTPALSTTVRGIATSGYHNWNPDCGGIEAYNQSGIASSGVEGVVVFQRDAGGGPLVNTDNSEIHAVIITGSSTGITVGSLITVGASASNDYDYPSVTKVSAGADASNPADWVVAHQQYNLNIAGDDWDAVCRRIFADGTFDSRTWVPSINTGAHRIDVKVEGQRGRYLVIYGRADEAGTLTKITGRESNQAMRERFDYPVGGTISKQSAVEASLNQSSRTIRSYDVGYDTDNDSIWCTLWAAPGGSGRIFIQRVDYNGEDLEVERLIPPSGQSLPPAGIAFNDDTNNWVIGYGQMNGELYGVEMDYPTEIAPSDSPSSCSPATLRWQLRDANDIAISNPNQDQQIGSQFTHLTVRGATANAFHFVVVTFASGGTTSMPLGPPFYPAGAGCMQYVVGSGPFYIGILPLAIGSSAAWRVSLPAFLGVGDVHFQDFHSDAAGTMFLTTRRLTVPLVK